MFACVRPTWFFDYNECYQVPRLEAYEKALLDCIAGDQMLFWRQDAVELCWSYLDELIASCESCPLHRCYPAGSWGPPSALGLTSRPKKRQPTSRAARRGLPYQRRGDAWLAWPVQSNPERERPAK